MKNTEEKLDGYVSKITLPNGKTYGIKACIVEVYPINCPKCGSSFQLKYGSGRCPYCDTYFTTQFKLVENNV